MAGNLKDILTHLSTEVDQETLMRYLNGQLSEEQKHEVEKKMLGSDFSDDAMEGLQQFKNKEKLTIILDQLDHDLKKKLLSKKKRRQRLQIKEQPWIYIAAITILVLIVVSYIVIRKMML